MIKRDDELKNNELTEEQMKEIVVKNYGNSLTKEQEEELVHQAYMVYYNEISKRDDATKLEDPEDIIQNMLCYQFGKKVRGKNNLFDLKQSYSEKHFLNTLHQNARNDINYLVRQPKNKARLNTVYLYDDANKVGMNKTSDRECKVIDIVKGDEKLTTEFNIFSELDDMLDKIDIESTSKPIIIKYKDSDKCCSFNYKSFLRLYDYLATNKRVANSKFKGFLFNAETGEELSIKQISQIINEFKLYLLENNILGGIKA